MESTHWLGRTEQKHIYLLDSYLLVLGMKIYPPAFPTNLAFVLIRRNEFDTLHHAFLYLHYLYELARPHHGFD